MEDLIEIIENSDAKVKNKRITFKKGLLIYSAVLVVLSLIALSVLWVFLSSFQKSDSQSCAQTAVNNIDKAEWMEFLKENIYVSEYEDGEAANGIAYKTLIENNALVCSRKANECTEDTEVFTVSNGEEVFCKLQLKKDDEGAFGFNRWVFDGISPCDDRLYEHNAEKQVLFPSEGTLYINGTKVDAGETESIPCPYDVIGDNEPDYASYSFKEPWSDYEVKLNYDGGECLLEERDGGIFPFEIAKELRYDCTVTVPAGTELYIDGERATTNYITESDAAYPYLSPLELNAETAPKATVYKFTGLYTKPEIKATYNGTEISCKESEESSFLCSYSYALPFEPSEYSLLVPFDTKVYINGIELGEEYVTEKNIVYTEVSDYSELLVNPKTLCRYTVKDLLFAPEISVKDAFGTECPLTEINNNEFCCTSAPNPDKLERYDEFAKAFAVAMVEFTMEDPALISQNMSEALAFTRYDSPANQVICNSYIAFVWQKKHTLTYNSLYTDNYISYGDNAFSCDIHYDVTGVRTLDPTRIDNISGVYRIVCIDVQGKLEIVKLNVDSEE